MTMKTMTCFLEQTTNLLPNSSGSDSSENGGGGIGRTRRNGAIMGYAKLESEPKQRPAFYLGMQPDDEKRKEKGSFMYSPEPVPEVEKILYSALKENPMNPKRPRLVSNRTSNVSFSDLPISEERPQSEQMSPTAEDVFVESDLPKQNGCKPNGFEPKLHETYSYTSKHTIVW